MKRIAIVILLLCISTINTVLAKENITGRWVEKISERVVADIYANQNDDKYQIFITWREDNLAQKDIYRFTCTLDKNRTLKYTKGIHIYRFYNSNGKFEDKIDYVDGSGEFKIRNNEIIWLDNKDNSESVFIRANSDLTKDTTINKLFSNTLPVELKDRYNPKKDYFDYSVVLEEFPKNYYYTTVKINKSKERILIITDKINENKNANYGLFYYFAKNGFVYPLGCIESTKPLSQSEKYLYLNNGNENIRFYMSDKELKIIKSKASKINERIDNIEFITIKSSDKFKGDFGEAAGDDIVKVTLDGFYFEYHKPQYKRKYIKNLMKECINDGVKTQVQMYCCMVKKLHPKN